MSRKSRNVDAEGRLSRRQILWSLLFLHLGISPVFFSTSTIETFDYPKSILLQLVALLAIAWMLAAAGAAARSRFAGAMQVVRDPLSAGFLLLASSAILSTVLSISPLTSLSGAAESYAGLPTLLSLVTLYFATRTACESWAQARYLLAAPIVGAGVAASYACLQSLGIDVFSWTRVAEFGGLRPFGTLGHPNALASFEVACLPLVAVLAILAARRGQTLVASALAVMAVVAAIAIVRSASRAGWVGLVIGILGVFVALRWTGGKKGAAWLIAVSAGAVATAFVIGSSLPSGHELFSSLSARLTETSGFESRRFLWSTAVDLFREHPWTGVGVDAFGLAFSPRRTPEFWALEWNTSFARAHNEFLQLLATQGIPGGIAGLLLVLGVGRSVVAGWRTVEPDQRLTLAATAIGAVALLPQLLLGVLSTSVAILLVTLLAVLSTAARPRNGVIAKPRPPLRMTRLLGFLILGGFVLTASSWQGSAAGQVAVLVVFASPLVISLFLRWPAAGSLAPSANAPPSRASAPRAESRWPVALSFAIATGLFVTSWRGRVSADLASALGTRLSRVNPEAGLKEQEKAVALDPTSAAHRIRLAQAAQALASRSPSSASALRERARAAFDEAIALQPLEGRYEMLLCRLIVEQALESEAVPGEALDACDRALAKEPSNPYFYTAAVGASVRLGDRPRARRLVQAGLHLFPNLGPLLYQRGFIALQDGRLDEADRVLRAAGTGDWHGQKAGRSGVQEALVEVARLRPR